MKSLGSYYLAVSDGLYREARRLDAAVLARWPALWESAAHWVLPAAMALFAIRSTCSGQAILLWAKSVSWGVLALSMVIHVVRRSPYESARGLNAQQSYLGLLCCVVALTPTESLYSICSVALAPSVGLSLMANAARFVRFSTLTSFFLVAFMSFFVLMLGDGENPAKNLDIYELLLPTEPDKKPTEKIDLYFGVFSAVVLAVSGWLVVTRRSHRGYSLSAFGIFLCGGALILTASTPIAKMLYFAASFVFRELLVRAALIPARSR